MSYSKATHKNQTDQQKILKKLGGGNRLASKQIQALLEDDKYKNIVKVALLKHAQSEELKVRREWKGIHIWRTGVLIHKYHQVQRL